MDLEGEGSSGCERRGGASNPKKTRFQNPILKLSGKIPKKFRILLFLLLITDRSLSTALKLEIDLLLNFIIELYFLFRVDLLQGENGMGWLLIVDEIQLDGGDKRWFF